MKWMEKCIYIDCSNYTVLIQQLEQEETFYTDAWIFCAYTFKSVFNQ